MSQKQSDNWHIDFASKVQDKNDRNKKTSSSDSRTSGSKVSNDDDGDDPLTKTFRRRDLRRELAQARVHLPTQSERTAPRVGPDGRRRPKRTPPPNKPPPPQQSPMNNNNIHHGDFGGKINDDNRISATSGSVRPPPNNPYRPPRGKPPPPSSPNRFKNNNDKYNNSNGGRELYDANKKGGKIKRRPPPRGKPIPRPRGMNPNNPRSIDNSGGASTSQLIAFATRHQAQIQKQQTHYIRKPPPGQPPRSRNSSNSDKNPNFKPPVPKGVPLPKHNNYSNNERRPPRSRNHPNSKKPPPPSGPPPKSAIEAGIRARSRQSASNMFELGETAVYISDDDDDSDSNSDDEEYKKKKLLRQQGQAQIRRRPPGNKRMNIIKSNIKPSSSNSNDTGSNDQYHPRAEMQSSKNNNRRKSNNIIRGSQTNNISDSDSDEDKFYDAEEDKGSSSRAKSTKTVTEKKKKGRPCLSIHVDNSNKSTPRTAYKVTTDEGKVGDVNISDVVDEGKKQDKVVKKKKKRPNLTVMVTDSNHEAENASSNNNTSDNPFSGVGNLQINVDDGTQNFNETYHLSNSGAFNAEGFVIRETGIAKAPKDGKDSSRTAWSDNEDDGSGYGKNIRAEMLKLCVLGRGAGGIVYKSLHMPTMRIVAVKNIPVYESDKRHQMVCNIYQLLFANSRVIVY